jgi:thiol-disulfide isomerase/thioredoxin
MRLKSLAVLASALALSLAACSQKYESQLQASHEVKAIDEIAAVLVFAEWCPSCKVLDPKVEAVRGSEDWTGVSFILLDFTDRNAGQFFDTAEQAGIGPAIRTVMRHGIQTGQLILINLETQEAVGQISKDASVSEIARQIKAAQQAPA